MLLAFEMAASLHAQRQNRSAHTFENAPAIPKNVLRYPPWQVRAGRA